MKIPDVAYEAEFIGYDEIDYYPRKNTKSDNSLSIVLPAWLTALIQDEVEKAESCGYQEALKKVRQAIGIEEN